MYTIEIGVRSLGGAMTLNNRIKMMRWGSVSCQMCLIIIKSTFRFVLFLLVFAVAIITYIAIMSALPSVEDRIIAVLKDIENYKASLLQATTTEQQNMINNWIAAARNNLTELYKEQNARNGRAGIIFYVFNYLYVRSSFIHILFNLQ